MRYALRYVMDRAMRTITRYDRTSSIVMMPPAAWTALTIRSAIGPAYITSGPCRAIAS